MKALFVSNHGPATPVLILIVMEDTHEASREAYVRICRWVLILIVMEDTHEDYGI